MLCIDHPVVQGMIPRVSDRRIVTYGFSPQADVRAVDVRLGRDGSQFDAVIADRPGGRGAPDSRPDPADVRRAQCAERADRDRGRQRVGIGDEVVRERLRKFAGVKRRFTKTGEWNGVT